MQRTATEISNNKNKEERARLIERMSRKELERLCKALGLSSEGHVAQLRSRIIHSR